jgi:hypothetical protein
VVKIPPLLVKHVAPLEDRLLLVERNYVKVW